MGGKLVAKAADDSLGYRKPDCARIPIGPQRRYLVARDPSRGRRSLAQVARFDWIRPCTGAHQFIGFDFNLGARGRAFDGESRRASCSGALVDFPCHSFVDSKPAACLFKPYKLEDVARVAPWCSGVQGGSCSQSLGQGKSRRRTATAFIVGRRRGV